MKNVMQQVWQEDDGVLSFEWVLLLTLLAIGVVGGLAAARDAIIDELGDVAEGIINIDQSYSFAGVPCLGIPPSECEDEPEFFEACDRGGIPGQDAQEDSDS